MATKQTADKLAARYGKITDALSKIDARKAKAERTLASIDSERDELTLKAELVKVQFAAAGGDVETLGAAPLDSDEDETAEAVAEADEDETEDEDDEDEDFS